MRACCRLRVDEEQEQHAKVGLDELLHGERAYSLPAPFSRQTSRESGYSRRSGTTPLPTAPVEARARADAPWSGQQVVSGGADENWRKSMDGRIMAQEGVSSWIHLALAAFLGLFASIGCSFASLRFHSDALNTTRVPLLAA